MPVTKRCTQIRARRLVVLNRNFFFLNKNQREDRREEEDRTSSNSTVAFAISRDDVVLLNKTLDALSKREEEKREENPVVVQPAWKKIMHDCASIRCASHLAIRGLISKEELACVAALSSSNDLFLDLLQEGIATTQEILMCAVRARDSRLAIWIVEDDFRTKRGRTFDLRACMRHAIENSKREIVQYLQNVCGVRDREFLHLSITLRNVEMTLCTSACDGDLALEAALRVTSAQGVDQRPDWPWVCRLHRTLRSPSFDTLENYALKSDDVRGLEVMHDEFGWRPNWRFLEKAAADGNSQVCARWISAKLGGAYAWRATL